jgi:hypothetical protein
VHWGNAGAAVARVRRAHRGHRRHGRSDQVRAAWIRDARKREQARAREAEAQASLAREQEKQIVLDRRRSLNGWSPGGLDTFAAALVTTGEEMDQAREELICGGRARYVILRIDEGDPQGGSVNRALRLRQIIENEGLISRPPSAGEREALEAGLDALGIPWAGRRVSTATGPQGD